MRFRQKQYEQLVCTECDTTYDAGRFKEGDACREKNCNGKLIGDDSTLVKHCPICVSKLSGDCAGDLEGCGAFKIRG